MNAFPFRYLRPSNLLIIFDLDGTLIDSSEDLAISTNATREHFGWPPLSASVIQSYVGNGAATLVRRAFGSQASEQLVNDALSFFLIYYRAHSLQHTRLYPGIAEAVNQLSGEGHGLAVLTNKPSKISVDILKGLGLANSFLKIYGGDSFAEKKPNPIGIQTLQREQSTSAEDTWMIGDSAVDIQTARNAGVRACGVSWGFQPNAFTEDVPDHVVNAPGEWLSLFRVKRNRLQQ